MEDSKSGSVGSSALVLNPVSGTTEHVDRVRSLAADHGVTVYETDAPGDAVDLAHDLGDADLVAAAGGDGTLNAVVYGLWKADAIADTTVSVVPCGTGNNFAGNVGITDVEHSFEILEDGERRDLDLALATGNAGTHHPTVRPFVNSCVAGITADASVDTDPASKSDLGVMAYVLNTLRRAVEFDGLPVYVETSGDAGTTWEGEAVMVLVGNGRRFPERGQTQANIEDGLLDVTIVENRPAADLVSEAALSRLFDRDVPHITRLKTPSLTLELDRSEPTAFSLDGELLSTTRVTVETHAGRLRMPVGDGYDPDGAD